MTTSYLLFIVIISIALLLVLVIRFKLNAFIALLLVSVFAGLGAGMELQTLLKSIQNGMGGILGFVAIVVGLGSIFGEMLDYSGGAKALAIDLIRRFGYKRSSWAMSFTGFLVAIPVFFDVGCIILVPVIYSLSRETGKSLTYFAVPLLAGLAVWMINNQLGRRNLNPLQLSYFRGIKYLTSKKDKGGYAKVLSRGHINEFTADSLAHKFKASPSTIKRNAHFAVSLSRIGKANPELKKRNPHW